MLLLRLDVEGTKVQVASSIREIKELMEKGFSVAEAAISLTEPKQIGQLSLFNE